MKKNICKAMVLMSVALMSISPVMAESNDDVMVISENSQAKKVDDVIIIDDGPMLGMPSPIKDFDTVEEAQKSLGFVTKVPTTVPEGFKVTYFETISDDMLQIIYSNGKDEVYYRTAKKNSDTEDITGDYNTYKEEKNVEINGTSVTVKGDGKKYYNALCTKDNMIYSLFAREGLDLEQIEGFLSVLNDDSNVADNILGMPNPIKDFNTIEEAQKSLSFDTKVPKNVPEKYKAVAFETISDKILQIVYSDGKNEVTYRTAQGTEDITGDYNKYAYVKKLKINDADVTIKGNGTKVYNVLCTKNDVTYSVFARQGISLSEIKTFLNK